MAGFNSQIKYKGTSFHIQTQDKGTQVNHLESLIYKSGGIISSRKTSYASLLGGPDFEKKVNQLMKKQHLVIINEISEGKFDRHLDQPEKPELDQKEVLSPTLSSEKLKTEISGELGINIVNFSFPSSAGPVSFSLEVSKSPPPKLISYAKITALAIDESGREYFLFTGETDEEGKTSVGLLPPPFPEKKFTLCIKTEKEGFEPDEVKISLKQE
jgi:hypothetical protein